MIAIAASHDVTPTRPIPMTAMIPPRLVQIVIERRRIRKLREFRHMTT
jgi:hypothetical protein